jgi:hypothetical protein
MLRRALTLLAARDKLRSMSGDLTLTEAANLTGLGKMTFLRWSSLGLIAVKPVPRDRPLNSIRAFPRVPVSDLRRAFGVPEPPP